MNETIKAFFAYPSEPPSLAETIRESVRAINTRSPGVRVTSWEDCRIGGKVIVDEICRVIDGSELFLADLTGVNPNVMFELGYAIGRKKRIWIVLDTTVEDARRDYDQLRLLTTVGYRSYSNSVDIATCFAVDRPYEDPDADIFGRSIQAALGADSPAALLYLKSCHAIEASRKLDALIRRCERAGLSVIVDDPSESRVQPLSWYAQKIYTSSAVLAHFCGPRRSGARLHNARYAFVSGLACGFDKLLLMLAEDDYDAPIDYKDLMRFYSTGRECAEQTEPWLNHVKEVFLRKHAAPTPHLAAIELVAELRSLRFGEYIAENEQDQLDDYFVETSSYNEALEGRHTIFVGRKGTGKTANLLRMAAALGRDKRNLVCVVKPVGYEIDGLVRLLRRYKERDAKGYLVESLWKFLLYSELAKTTAEWIESLQGPHDQAETDLIGFLDSSSANLREDFSIRLERCVDALSAVAEDQGIEAARSAISEALHDGVLRNLRALLRKVLERRSRVAILVDNLDKGWDKGSDLPHLTELLLGLLGAARPILTDLGKSDRWRSPVRTTLTIFLRSDIFDQIMRAAREKDKISYSRLTWNDPEILLRVIEERFVSARGQKADPSELWTRFFCPSVRGRPTRLYLYERILPRPRDLVFLCNAAVAMAVNRGHSQVEERDILDAEKQYSQYALDAVQVENGISMADLESILFEFVGRPAVLSEQDVRSVLSQARVPEADRDSVIEHLLKLSFLGHEVRQGEFSFAEDDETQRKDAVLARLLVSESGMPPRYCVNAPFRAFLEIEEP